VVVVVGLAGVPAVPAGNKMNAPAMQAKESGA